MTTTIQPATATGAGASTAARLRAIGAELSERYLERDEVVHGLLAAVLAGQHVLLLGPPGCAKSELLRSLTGRIHGAVWWETALHPLSVPEDIFGPVDASALMHRGHYTQMFEGRATRAHVVFVDEIFAAEAVLPALNPFLNERIYHPLGGGSPVACQLISAVTAANELPTGSGLRALYDRLLVRFQVGYLTEPTNLAALLDRAATPGAPAAPPTTIALGDLEYAISQQVPSVAVPEGVRDLLVKLFVTLREEQLGASDRRHAQCVRLVQAAAYLAGRARATDADLEILTHALWDDPDQRRQVQQHVLALVNPYAKDAKDLEDVLDTVADELADKIRNADGTDESVRNDRTWAIHEALPKLSRAADQLAELREQARSGGCSTAAIDAVAARCHTIHQRIMAQLLGVDANGSPFPTS